MIVWDQQECWVLNYHQIIGKIEEPEGRKYLMVDDFMLDKVLDKIKEIIGIEKFTVRFWLRRMIISQMILL